MTMIPFLRWGAVVASLGGVLLNATLLIIFLVCLARFPKRTYNILSLIVCDLGSSVLWVVMLTVQRDKVS